MHNELLFKIKTLMVLRVVVISIFLGTIIIFQIKLDQLPFTIPVTVLIIVTYLLTIVYSILLTFIKNLKFFSYIQLIGDLLVESGVIYISGGIESPFPFLYILSIIAASIILYKRGSYIIASISSILYGSMANLEFYNILHPLTFYTLDSNISSIGEAVIYTVSLNISAFYMVAFLSGYLSEKLKRTGEELEEKSEDLIQLKTFHESVVKNMGSGLVTADLNGRIVSFNQAAAGITGYKFTEVRGKPYYNFFNIPPLEDHYNNLIENPIHNEGVFIRKDGRKIYFAINISLLKDEGNNVRGIIGVFDDMTRIKDMEEKVIKSEKLAAIGRITAGIAHEIRNPLASISGSIQVLKDELSLGDSNKRLMEIILRETERLNSIITQFLIYASPSKKYIHRCNMLELINETITLLKNSKDYPQNIDIVTSFTEGEIFIHADSKQMKQVLWNLCLNSIHAMDRGGTMTITAKRRDTQIHSKSTTNSPDQGEEEVEITIHDTGIGIPEANLEKIFDPFFTTKENGSGLGLSTVLKIIEGHNGSIHLKSKEGKGTKVKIILPIQ
ncbi:MAG: PAS domain S-box protein [Nitrospinae bacterium]|nr:PAS domain S-box protein [Nitrospinota bacterium]